MDIFKLVILTEHIQAEKKKKKKKKTYTVASHLLQIYSDIWRAHGVR